jgi:hypothetical protein
LVWRWCGGDLPLASERGRRPKDPTMAPRPVAGNETCYCRLLRVNRGGMCGRREAGYAPAGAYLAGASAGMDPGCCRDIELGVAAAGEPAAGYRPKRSGLSRREHRGPGSRRVD